MTPLGLARLWFGLSLSVSRRAYALSGFGLTAFKYAVEAWAVHAVTGRWKLWADRLIHAIHTRVLGHIKRLSEA